MDTGMEGAFSRMNFQGNTASGEARQHNGNVHNNYSYAYTLRQRKSDETLREDGRNKLLLKAAAEGQAPRVRYLLQLGVDVDHFDDLGLTALHHAALSGFEDVTSILIDAGADVNALSDHIGNPLHLACLKSRTAVANLLLTSRANVHTQGRLTGTSLHCAVRAGDLEIVEALLAHGSSTHMQSVYCGDIMKQLLEHGSEWKAYLTEALSAETKSVYSIRDRTPLHVGYEWASDALVNGLLRQGSSQSYASMWDVPNLVDTAANRSRFGDNVTPLMLAAMNHDSSVLTLSLNEHPNVSSRDSDGWTALIYAACIDEDQNIKALLDAGADINAQSNVGDSPVTLAAQEGRLEVVRVLIENGADLNLCDNDEWTALHYASNKGHVKVVRSLLQSGADINAQDSKGCVVSTRI